MAPELPDGLAPAPKQRRTPQRRTLSCLPCRESKVRCNRQIPCASCRRYGRERECETHPSPAFVAGSTMPTYPKTLKQTTSQKVITKISSPRVSLRYLQATANCTDEYVNEIASPRSERDPSVSPGVGTGASFRPVSRVAEFSLWKTLKSLHPESIASSTVDTDIPNSWSPTPFIPAFVSHTETGHELTQWRIRLVEILPTQTQCDFLTSYFFENINWIYQVLHVPTFRKAYQSFWNGAVADIDLIWLSLLYTVISISALCLPCQLAEAMSFEAGKMTTLSRTWHSASRQCLHAGGFESKACTVQLQTYLITQLYWFATKDVETLNSCLGQAVRTAQTLGLDKDTMPARTLEEEMRHRIWWDLCSSDTFQSVCLSRQPLIEAHSSLVPIPLNCNAVDITETNVSPRPLNEPTEMSMNVFRAQLIRVMNRLYINNGTRLSSLEFIMAIDLEIITIWKTLPWYMQISPAGTGPNLPPEYVYIRWQQNLLHTFTCVQRIRMYRPFLHGQSEPARSICTESAQNALAAYRALRNENPTSFLKSHHFISQNYQTFSTAITLAVFLLVEQPPDDGSIRADIEMVISDLDTLQERGTVVPMVIDGVRVLRKVLEMYDLKGRDGESEPTSLVPAIYSVIGGKSTTQKYLERCGIRYIINSERSPEAVGSLSTEIEMPMTPISYIQSAMISGQPVRDYTPVDFNFATGNVGFDMPSDHSFWDQWDY